MFTNSREENAFFLEKRKRHGGKLFHVKHRIFVENDGDIIYVFSFEI